MDQKQLYSLLNNQNLLKQTDRISLERIVKEYPWFQTAQLLLLKKYQLDSFPDFESKLNFTAAHMLNRETMFHFINDKQAKTDSIEQKTTSAAEVTPIEIKQQPTPVTEIKKVTPEPEIIVPKIEVEEKTKQNVIAAEQQSITEKVEQAFKERKAIESGNSELNEMLQQMRENRRKILEGNDVPKSNATEQKTEPAIADGVDSLTDKTEIIADETSLEIIAASNASAELSTDENHQAIEHDEVIDEHHASESDAILILENELLHEEAQAIKVEFYELTNQSGGAEVSPMNFEVSDENEFIEEGKEDAETLGIMQLEDEISLIEDDLISKEIEISKISVSEFNHKHEDEEPDDERLFEEKFDTEIEMLKKIESTTAEIKHHEISIDNEISDHEFIDDFEVVIESEPVETRTDFLNQQHSFTEWLKFFNKPALPGSQPIEVNTTIETPVSEPEIEPSISEFTHDFLATDNKEDLNVIDNYVQSIPNKKQTENTGLSAVELAKKSLELDGEIVTETLAQIYERQNKWNKAIDMYEKLSLKFPEKSTYFATLIKNLKNKI